MGKKFVVRPGSGDPSQYSSEISLIGPDGKPWDLESHLPSRLGVSTLSNIPAYNVSRTSLSKWRRALNKVNAGTANARVLAVGDSTLWGLLSGGADGAAPPKVLASTLDRRLAPTQYTFIVPPGVNGPTTGADLDSRIGTGGSGLLPSGWSYTSWGLGHSGAIQNTGTSTSTALEFRPGIECDTFEIFFLRNGGLGSLDLSVDGGSVTTVSCTGTLGWGKATITAPAGSAHVLSITKTLNTVFIFGVNAYLSTRKSIHVMNAGSCGARAFASGGSGASWTTTGAGHSLDGIPFLAPDLTLIQLGINDTVQGSPSSVTDWESATRSLIAAAKTTGDVILASVVPSDPAYQSGAPVALQQAYRDRSLVIAQDTGSAYFDLFGRFESWPAASAQGLIADTLHLSPEGSADVGYAYSKIFTAL